MRSTTTRAIPVSYSKCAHTFRTAVGDYPAARTHLGSHTFGNDNETHPRPTGLISKHVSQHRPTSVKHGLCHACFRQFGRANISDRYKFIALHKFGRKLMQKMFADVGNLGMDCLDPCFVSGALLDGQLDFKAPIDPLNINCSPVTHCGQSFKTQINTDNALAIGGSIINFGGKAHEPLAAGIFDQIGGFNFPFNLARLPKAVSAAFIGQRAIGQLECTGNHWNPTKGSLRAERYSKTRRMFDFITGFGKFRANPVHCIGMNAKISRATRRKVHEVKVALPSRNSAGLPTFFRFLLCGSAKVPNLIAGRGEGQEMFSLRTVFNSEFVSDNQFLGFSIGRSVGRSRGRGAVTCFAASLFLGQKIVFGNCKPIGGW